MLNPLLLDADDFLPSIPEHAKSAKFKAQHAVNDPIDSTKQEQALRNSLLMPPRFVDIGFKGRVLDTIPNTRALLDAANIEIKRNLMTREVEYSRLCNVQLHGAGKAFGYGCTDLDRHLDYLADQSTYHPVKEWVISKDWDGVDRFEALAQTLASDMPERLKKLLLGKWLIQCIELSCADDPKPAQGVLTFAGAQGIGKTSWIKTLCPIPKAVKTGVSLDVHDKDSKHMACQSWLTELGEVDSTFKRDIAALKAFITESEDRYRLPYQKDYPTYKRRTSFFASVNRQEFLRDETGNRRWWVIPVTSINHNHSIDVQQLWAQIYTWWASGTSYWLSADDQKELGYHNEQFEEVDPIAESILLNFLSPDKAAKLDQRYNATQVAKLIGINNPTKRDTSAITHALRKIGYQELARKIFAMPAPLPKPYP